MSKDKQNGAGAQGAPQAPTIESLTAELEAANATISEQQQLLNEANATITALSKLNGGSNHFVMLPAKGERPAITLKVKHGVVLRGKKLSAAQIAADPSIAEELYENRSSAIALG
jgi:hypothetical protein